MLSVVYLFVLFVPCFFAFLLDMYILSYVIVVIVYVFFIQRGQYFGETNLAKKNREKGCFQKQWYPKMDGENNGKPY